MISESNHRALESLAALKAKANGHILTAWIRTFHRLGTGAHCDKCYRMVYVLIDTNPPQTNGKALDEECK